MGWDEKDGSSPRARGTQLLGLYRDIILRFIPASAGNTPFMRLLQWARPVHPRERGEHRILIVGSDAPPGSSPRARGTLAAGGLVERLQRFIPASAGNTATARFSAMRITVHPRERGEHLPRVRAATEADGSSPRARGTRLHPTGWRCRSRFIPASAGNTHGEKLDVHWYMVHPRERGEHRLTAAWASGSSGSSPRARGTHPWRRK